MRSVYVSRGWWKRAFQVARALGQRMQGGSPIIRRVKMVMALGELRSQLLIGGISVGSWKARKRDCRLTAEERIAKCRAEG